MEASIEPNKDETFSEKFETMTVPDKKQLLVKQSAINLENVLLIEDKLWSLLEVLRYIESQSPSSQEEVKVLQEQKMNEVAFLCDEWWEITHEDNINYLDKVFQKDDALRRAVRQSLISLLLVVTTCYNYAIEQCANPDSRLPPKVIS